MLRDTDVGRGAPAAATTIGATDLHDATDDALGGTDADAAAIARTALDAARGWRVNLAAGEKSLSRLVSFEGALMATTYQPEDDAFADPCSFAETRRFYTMDLATARAANLDAGGAADPGTPRSKFIEGSGIPASPLAVFPEGSTRANILDGTKVEATVERRLQRVYWHAR